MEISCFYIKYAIFLYIIINMSALISYIFISNVSTLKLVAFLLLGLKLQLKLFALFKPVLYEITKMNNLITIGPIIYY